MKMEGISTGADKLGYSVALCGCLLILKKALNL